ncbi:hypothetical protein [Paraburkholderia terrae]
MADFHALSAKAWQVHDVLRIMSAALPEDTIDSEVPLHGALGVLISLAHEVADSVSDLCGTSTGNRATHADLNHYDLHKLIDSASGEFAAAVNALNAVSGLFEAIVTATKPHEQVRRLAELGLRSSTEHAEALEDAKTRYNDHSKRISEAVTQVDGEYRRVRAPKYSSRGNA